MLKTQANVENQPEVSERVCECDWCEPVAPGLWTWVPKKVGRELVRCKDCKHCDLVRGEPYCLRLAVETDPDGFCHWGERRRT